MTETSYLDDAISAGRDLLEGAAKGLDLPAYIQDSLTYDEDADHEVYSLGARIDHDRGYTPVEDDPVYEAGSVLGAGVPAVAFLGTANPVFLAPYAPSAVIGGIKTVERYLEQDDLMPSR